MSVKTVDGVEVQLSTQEQAEHDARPAEHAAQRAVDALDEQSRPKTPMEAALLRIEALEADVAALKAV